MQEFRYSFFVCQQVDIEVSKTLFEILNSSFRKQDWILHQKVDSKALYENNILCLQYLKHF